MSDGQEATVLTGAGIEAWRFLSRMHQLALEINTGLRAARVPLLHAMYREGLIDADLRGTRANKRRVLSAMVDVMSEHAPGFVPSVSIRAALSTEAGK